MVSDYKKFKLEKWFLDFIGDDGTVMIFYFAKLNWLSFEFSYTSFFKYSSTNKSTFLSRFTSPCIPQTVDNKIIWNDNILQINGIWKSIQKPIQQKIYQKKNNFLIWNCLQPKSEVEISVDNDPLLLGTGYVEKLSLNIPPWKLPMDTLRWGRYYDSTNTIVWIQMLNKEFNQQWLWLNGELENAIITDDYINIPRKKFILTFTNKRLLEKVNKINTTLQTLLNYTPIFFKNIIPQAFFNAKSYKWISDTSLTKNESNTKISKCIHELVIFK